MAKKVSVIITVLNEVHTVEGLLTALFHQTLQPAEIIVVDGGSSDGTVDRLNSLQKTAPVKMIIFTHAGNRSVGRNAAITQARHSIIAITDAGCIPHRDWLAELLMAYEGIKTGHQPVIVAGYYDARPQTPFQEAVVPYVLVMPDQVKTDHFLPATRSMLLDKAAWERVGGFNEALSDNEDYAFARRAAQHSDIALTFTPKAKVTWLPRSNLRSFGWMIFRFARGDAQAGLWRPKVVFIFVRYLLGIVLVLWLATFSWLLSGLLLLGGLVGYSGWAMAKNRRYVPNGWYWLPVLQLVSDGAVMLGSVSGLWLSQR